MSITSRSRLLGLLVKENQMMANNNHKMLGNNNYNNNNNHKMVTCRHCSSYGDRGRQAGRIVDQFSSDKRGRLGENKTELKGQPRARGLKTDHKNMVWLDNHVDGGKSKSTIRERNSAVTSYYNQHSIDRASEKPSIRLTPMTIMYSSITEDNDHDSLRSAQYLHRELPIRIAKRIIGFRLLPFIVGCNPTILAVHELYIRAFHKLNDHPPILTKEDVNDYNILLKGLIDDHKDVNSDLAQGFKEARKHINDEAIVRDFLDAMLTNRLSIRMLLAHHFNLNDNKLGHIGIINLNMNLKNVIRQHASYVQEITENKYGHAPLIKISGHTEAVFPYIELPLEYILVEVLKNAARSTIESHPAQMGEALPPIHVVIANNDQDFIIKFSDRGGGIPHNRTKNVMKYNFTTAEESTDKMIQNTGVFGTMMEAVNSTSGPMHGYGFGLPTSAAYANYMGGNLKVMSMQGLGTDVHLRLLHLDSKLHELRI